ncbi:MAG: alginate export family protein [Ignavibacteriaceae bacterium]
MNLFLLFYSFTIIFLFIAPFSPAQSESDDLWKLNGNLQLRSELDGRDFSDRTHPLTFTSMRTRLSIEKSFLNSLDFLVQVSDSRVFGQEKNTLASIDNLDLHQAYVKLHNPFDLPVSLQAGRFEYAKGTERFFGAVGWHYVGRSWDGVVLGYRGCFDLDLFAFTHTESNSYIGSALPSTYPYPALATPSYSIYGFWENNSLGSYGKLDLFGYYEVDRTSVQPENSVEENLLDRFTIGINHSGNYGNFSSLTEAAYQFGSTSGTDVSAYLVSLQLFYKENIIRFGAGADILSGTETISAENNSFAPTFGTNHKFYGYMDYFVNIPISTANSGLHDFYLKADINPENSDFSFYADLHHFTSDVSRIFEDQEMNTFGQEIDLTVKYNFIKGTTLTWGGSVFIPNDLFKQLFKTPDGSREDTAFWTYLMISANIH